MKTKHLPQSIIDTAIMEYSIICFAHVHKKQKNSSSFSFFKSLKIYFHHFECLNIPLKAHSLVILEANVISQ